jgi:zinc D-Ala-D-Ala carboxypeptidase
LEQKTKQKMSKISEHLDLSEVIRSETAKRLGVSNTPTPEHIENFKKLAENVFEKIRNNFRVPIHISSGYRSVELNRAIKGSSSSQHCKGEAIDIDMDGSSNGVTNRMVFDYIIKNLDFDQLIWEFGTSENPDWVHVSYSSSGNQRKQVLKAVRGANGTTYQPYVNKASI